MKFFKKIRQNSIKENKTLTYLKHATNHIPNVEDNLKKKQCYEN